MLKKNDSLPNPVSKPSKVEQLHASMGSTLVRAVAQFILLFIVLFAGFFGMNQLTAFKQQPPSRPPFQPVYTADTIIAKQATYQPQFLVYGEVQASRSIELRSLVAGEVVEVNPALKIGARLEKGDELFRIDPFVYERELATAVANLQETEAKISENMGRIKIEQVKAKRLREQLDLADKDFERIKKLRNNGTGTAKQVETRSLVVSQRAQALEQSELTLNVEESRMEQLEAIKERMDWSRMQAERNIKDTTLKAPISGVVSQKNVAVGRLLNANDVAVSMYEDDQLEVRFTLTDQRFGRVQTDSKGVAGRPVEVIWTVGGEEFRYKAEIDRIGAEIASSRGGIEVIAVIKEDVSKTALRPGAFVEIIVPDRIFKAHFKLPETALYNDDTVYVAIDGILQERKVEVKARDEGYIIVSGNLKDGEEVLVTRIAEISSGLKIQSPVNQNEADSNPEETTQ